MSAAAVGFHSDPSTGTGNAMTHAHEFASALEP
jgi:hypothetical protein